MSDIAEGELRRGIRVRRVYPLENGTVFCISTGSITSFQGGAIVNAANKGCLGGAGVDGAITKAGGPKLAAARAKLPVIPGTTKTRCPTGDARITIGGSLKSRYCIHAVGPIYVKGQLREGDQMLTSAYRASMALAEEKQLDSVALSLLSAGIFKGPRSLNQVLKLAVEAVAAGTYQGLQEVHLMAFKDEERTTLIDICDELLAAASETPPTEEGVEEERTLPVVGDPRYEKVLEVFKACDLDGDGTISASELLNIIQRLNPDFGDEAAEEIIVAMDTDHDQKIQFAEMLAWMFDKPESILYGASDIGETDAPVVALSSEAAVTE